MISFILSPRFFPIVIIALFVLAAGRYAIAKDWPQVWYYFGAVVLNVAVLCMAGAK
jgi:hypothetical protein